MRNSLVEGSVRAGKAKGRMSRVLGVALAAAVAIGTFGAGVGMWMKNGGTEVYADSSANAQDSFSDTVTSRSGGSYTVPGVHQSTSTTSVTTFGSAMPLSTIYIDTSKLSKTGGTYEKLADSSNPNQADFADGITTLSSGMAVYDPSGQTLQLLAGRDNYLAGNLFSYTFKGAATLSDGSSANVKITYSNAHIFVDQRLGSSGADTALQGSVNLAQGNSIEYYNNDTNDYSSYNSKITGSSANPVSGYGATQRAVTGLSMDARIQIVDDNGNPIDGTFIFPVRGLNVDRSPASGTNYAKPLWYIEDIYPEYNYFSEAMRINSGNVSDVYVRPNTSQTEGSGDTGYYYHRIEETTAGAYQGAINFISDSSNPKGVNGSNTHYATGFIVTADAASGISVTGTGHGAGNGVMNTFLEQGTTIWHRIRSVTGPGGNIQTTTEANYGGDLSDGGDVLGQGTYVVPDGKTVVYTLTPDTGYVLKELRINNDITSVPSVIPGVDTMKAGDVMTYNVNTNKRVTITKLADDSYTVEFPENNADHTIMVTWIPDSTEGASVTATKKWYDVNNNFATRSDGSRGDDGTDKVYVHVNGMADYGNGESYNYPNDFLPAQKESTRNSQDGLEDWKVIWGDGEKNNHRYTGAEYGETVYAKISDLPTQDSASNPLYYFYDYETRQFRAYTYNTTTGEFNKTNDYYWVNFMPKYDESGHRITYTVEEEVPEGYSLTTIMNNAGTSDPNLADFDYTLINSLTTVGTVRIKAEKDLDGRELDGTDKYIFVLAGEDGAPMPVNSPAKIPKQGEDDPERVVSTVTVAEELKNASNTNISTVRAEADFGIISYRKSDLTGNEIKYNAANAEQLAAIRFWTANGIVYDMKDATSKANFDALAASEKNEATGYYYEKTFTYVVTENPTHPDYVENETATRKITVHVSYNENENKFYIDDEDTTTAANGVKDITAETNADLNAPKVTLHKVYFTNRYTNSTTWDPELTKTLNGRPIKKDQYKDFFTIKAIDTGESVAGQVSPVVTAAETPMPGGSHGGEVKSNEQEIKEAKNNPKGTNEVKAIVGFDTITYTNDDLKKEVYFNGATDAVKRQVLYWENGSVTYGPIPADATATVTLADGSKGTVVYNEATEAQRIEAQDSGWSSGGRTYIDDSLMNDADRNAALAGSKGYYYMDSRNFTYKIWESGTATAGYTNDPHKTEDGAYTVVVTVKREADGTLKATPSMTVDGLLFENKYEAKETVAFKATKDLEGRDLKANEFAFTVTAVGDAPEPTKKTAANAADGTIDFGTITFTQDNLKSDKADDPGAYNARRTVDGFYEKDFVYTITETAKNSDGLTSDTKTITCVVTVREDNEGHIKVVAVNGNTAADGSLKTSFTDTEVKAGFFTNEYTASGSGDVVAKKTLDGGSLKADDFYFQLLDNQGNVIGTSSNDGSGNIVFTVAYNIEDVRDDAKAGKCTTSDSTAPDNGPWEYTYTVKELTTDGRGEDSISYDATGTTAGYTVKVKVTDDGVGNLTAVQSGNVTFTNTVNTRDFTVTKMWVDKDADGISNVTRPDEVTLTITADTNDDSILTAADGWTKGSSVSTKTVTLKKSEDATTNDAVWVKTIKNLPRNKADGTAISYSVDEEAANVPANYTKTVVNAINMVVNTYEVTSITGTKKWVDGGKAHAISADLDGKLTVKWTDTNDGSGTVDDAHIDFDNAACTYTVIGLPRYSEENGSKYLRTYFVEETQLEGYKEPEYDNSANDDADLKTVTNRAYSGATITNKITGTTDVTGTKIWKDADNGNAAGTTPTLTLHRMSTKTGASEDTDFTSPAATWNAEKTEYTFKEQDKYDDEGYEYTYWVTEDTLEGYQPPVYSDTDRAYNGGSITNIKEATGTLDIKATKILTGSTRLSEWSDTFKLSLFTGLNGSDKQIGATQTVGSGTLAQVDGSVADRADVTFEGLELRTHNEDGTLKGQIKAADNSWIDLTDEGNGTYTTTLYVYEAPVTENAEGLTQPSDGGTQVKVTLTDNRDGTVSVTTDAEGYPVTNEHSANAEATINVKKTLDGRDIKTTDAFSFTAAYKPDDSLSDIERQRLSDGFAAKTSDTLAVSSMTVTGNTATGGITYTFTRTGTFKFKVTESGSVDGVTNDTKDGEVVTVVVSKEADGKLKTEVSYADGAEADFTNTYTATGQANLEVNKVVSGSVWDESMTYWFDLAAVSASDDRAASDIPMPDTTRAAATSSNHTAGFALEGFTLADAGVEFNYSITEQAPSFTGYEEDKWNNDTSAHTVKIVPYDKGDGSLGFRYYYDGSSSESTAPLTVTNRKKGNDVNIFASKEVVDRDGNAYWPAGLGSFTVTLYSEIGSLSYINDIPMPDGYDTDGLRNQMYHYLDVSTDDTKVLDFGLISLDSAYEKLTGENASRTFTYTVIEVDTGAGGITYPQVGYTVEVTISKENGVNKEPIVKYYDASGNEIDTSKDGYPVITNIYKAEEEVSIEFKKVLANKNLEANKYSFTLYDAEGNPLYKDSEGRLTTSKDDGNGTNYTLVKGSNDAGGNVSLSGIKFTEVDAQGGPLSFVIREDIPEGAKAQDDENITYSSTTTLAERDAHVWIKDGVTYDTAITHPVTVTVTDDGQGTLTVDTAVNDSTVTNTYAAEGAHTFGVYKYLDNTAIARNGFTFELKADSVDGEEDLSAQNVPMPVGATDGKATVQILPDASYPNDGKNTFGEIKYTMKDLLKDPTDDSQGYVSSRVFVYKISEVKDESDTGITYSNAEYTVKVTVTDNGDGTLKVESDYTKEDDSKSKFHDNDTSTVDFTNTYDSDGTADLASIKEVLGRSWQDSDSFTLLIEPFENESIYSYTGATSVDAESKKKVEKVDVPLPGNSTADGGNMNASGQYEATVSTKSGDAVGSTGYQAKIDTIRFTDDMLTTDPTDGVLKGTFFYKITENTDGLSDKGFKQTEGSTLTYYARVDVTDDRAGHISHTVVYYSDAADLDDVSKNQHATPVFQNTYDTKGTATIPVAKLVKSGSDDKWDSLSDTDEFTFTISKVGNAPDIDGDDTITIKKGTDGHSASFTTKEIKLSDLTGVTASKGEKKYSDGADVEAKVHYAEFIYKVVENDHDVVGVDKDKREIYVKLTAIDKLDGKIDMKLTFYSDAACTREITTFTDTAADDVEFTNKVRDITDVKVVKTWIDGDKTNADRPDITFTLTRKISGGVAESLDVLDGNAKVYASDGTTALTYENGSVTAKADQLPVTIKNVPSEDEDGNEYTYSIVETDPTGYYQSKEPETKAALGDEPYTVTLTNTLTADIHVKKVWLDTADNSNRGSSVVAALKQNGRYTNMVQTVEADNEWEAVFEDLPVYDASGTAIEYTVKEMAVPEGYYTSVIEYSLDDENWSETLPEGWNSASNRYARIINILLRDVEVTKEWVGIPESNVTYELYRSSEPSADSAIRADVLTDLKSWTPDDTWEKVNVTHTFTTDEFDAETGGVVTYKFSGLERYDKNGTEYTYRVLETTTGNSYTASQTGDTKVVNTNVYSGAGKADPNVVKELSGRDWTNADTFYFKIEPVKKLEGGDGDWKNVTVTEFTDSDEDMAEKAAVPLPENQITTVTKSDTQVGAIGRSVDFDHIDYASGIDRLVGENKTGSYYYKIYETDAAGNALTGKTVSGITYDEAVHYLEVVVTDNGDGTVSTERHWDGADTTTAVPVFTNTYKAVGKMSNYIIKHIDDRSFEDGETFAFNIINVAGAPVRQAADEDASYDTRTQPVDVIGSGDDQGVYVSGSNGKYTQTGEASGSSKAEFAGVNYITSDDLTDGKGVFVYEMHELYDDQDRYVYNVGSLNYDENVVYLKLVVTDNGDGTLSVEEGYYTDAACTKPLTDVNGNIPAVLIDTATGQLAPVGKSEGTFDEDDGNGGTVSVTYSYVPAAYFRNTMTGSVHVTKYWVDEEGEPTPATDNVTVQLWRYAVSDPANPGNLPETYGESGSDWEAVEGGSYTYGIGEFSEDNGYSSTHAFERVDLIEEDTGKRYIFRVSEMTGSDAYETTYATVTKTIDAQSGEDIYTPGEYGVLDGRIADKNTLTTQYALAVRNKLIASNEANIAAVKQLTGRVWLEDMDGKGDATDRYHFTLKPLGKGIYDENYELVLSNQRAVFDTAAGTNIPMPEGNISTEAAASTNEAAHAVAADTTKLDDGRRLRETVGEGERLARFGSITYTLDDLVYDEKDNHMQGDFFYEMTEDIPEDATQNADGTFTYKGVTYESRTHRVHVKVRENRTGQLVVQVAYDETIDGDISTGTQFTPVYTNHYDAEGKPSASVDKYIMGRDWAVGDEFTFSLTPVGGAPFEAQKDSITAVMSVNAQAAGTSDKLSAAFDFGDFSFSLADLNKVTGTVGELTYSNGRSAPADTAYGQFLYAVEEATVTTADGAAALEKDTDTEYIRFTVIDMGDGTLDIQSEIFEDREARNKRYVSEGGSETASAPAFVNQALRDINVTKTWIGEPTADALITLQYGIFDDDIGEIRWTDYASHEFRKDEQGTNKDSQVINGLTLPVRSFTAVFEDVLVYAEDEDDYDLNDIQLKWRVVERTIEGVETYYGVDSDTTYEAASKDNKTADETDDPTIGSADPDDSAKIYNADDLDDDLYVTNVVAPGIEPAVANVSGVKDIKGRDWFANETYEFSLTPVGIGTYDDDGRLYLLDNGKADRDKLKTGDVPVPSGNAVAKVDSDNPDYQLSDSQWQTYFPGISVPVSSLELVSVDGSDVLQGDFFYDMREVIPGEAVATDKATGEVVAGITYADASEAQKADYNWKHNNMLYDTKVYEVHVHVERVGDSLSAEVSYDGKDVGGAVPVFTNRYEAPVIDIPVEKSWTDETGAPAAATDTVTVALYRYPVYMDGDGNIYSDETMTVPASLPAEYTDDAQEAWEFVADHTYQIGEFTQSNGYKKTIFYENVETDEMVDGALTGRKYIYRVKETTGSNSYETTYATLTGSAGAYTAGEYAALDGVAKDKNTMTTENGLAVRNTIVASNVANIAAVKQIVGRKWIESGEHADSYSFTLTAVKGVLGDGTGVGADKVPMPEDVTAQYKAGARTSDVKVGEEERLARFGEITYDLKDLAYNTSTGRMEGDFYYTMSEVVPDPADENITYDTSEHTVHVQVHENRTGKLEVSIAYDESEEGNISTGTQFTPVYVNKYKSITDTLKVTKVWNDDNNAAGLRPDSVKLHLYKQVGSDLISASAEEKEISGNGSAEWTGLPVYDDSYNKITYVVEEEAVAGYSSSMSVASVQLDGDTNAAVQEVVVTNTLAAETTTVGVTKVWDDSSNADGVRPTSVEVELYERVWDETANAYGAETKSSAAVLTLSGSGNEWTNASAFTNLPGIKNGRAVIYSVKEKTDLSTAGYKAPVVTGDQLAGFTITNSRDKDPDEIKVTYDLNTGGDDDRIETPMLRGENEPAQNNSVTRVGYTFGGWYRTQDASGNVTYTAHWVPVPVDPDPETITVTYDKNTGDPDSDEILSKEIERGEDEPTQPADPEREGYIFGGWLREVDSSGNVTYKANWIEEPEDPDPETITVKYVTDDDGTTILNKPVNRDENEPDQPADPTREGYTFGGWRRSQTADGDVTYTANWIENPADPVVEKITVTYVDGYSDGDAAKIKSDEIERGKDEPTQPANPTREGYTFGGWLRSVDANGNVTYTANWIENPADPVIEKITVTYVDGYSDGDAAKIKSEEIDRGKDEPAQPANPTRTGYTFGGWLREVDSDGNVTYTAQWFEEPEEPGDPEKITVKYITDEGAEPIVNEPIERGKDEPEQPTNPTKAGYKFGGWMRSMDDNGNVTYTASWIAIPTITVTYDKNTGNAAEDRTTTTVTRVDGNENEPAQPANPTRTGYTFTGWNRTADKDGNVTYTAQWEPVAETPEITVTYKNGDETVRSDKVAKDANEPEQPADPKQDGKIFAGWTRSQDADGNVTYTAKWLEAPTTAQITVTYKDGDKTIRSVTIDKGANEPEQPEDPTKEGKIFTGWTRQQDDVGNVTYTANWMDEPTTPAPEKVTVTYVDGQGNTLFGPQEFNKGDEEPAYTTYPEQEGFIFGGWIRSTDDDGNITYTARWIEDKVIPDPVDVPKTVTFIDPMADNVVLKSLDEDADGANVKPADPSHDGLQFTGWKEAKDKNGNTIITASYKSDCANPQNEIMIRYRDINDGNETVYQTSYILEDEDEPAAPADPVKDGFTFNGWEREEIKDNDGKVTSVIYTAKWTEVPVPVEKTHWVTYVDPDGSTIYLEKTTVKEGEAEPAAPADPSKKGYTFAGWDESVDADGNKTYTAKWSEDPVPVDKTHTVTYVDSDGKTVYLGPVTVKEGYKEPDAPSDPKKDNQTFGGWVRSEDSDGNVTYTAKWIPIVYTVTFVDGRTGEVIDKADNVVPHGSADVPNAKQHEGYEFKGWRTPSGELVTELTVTDVTRDLVYTAVYEPVVIPDPIVHTVTFIDSRSGDELKVDRNVADGGSTATPHVKEYEGYVFKGWWTPANTLVTELAVENVREDQTYVALYDRVYEEAITGQRIIHFRYIDEHGREVEEDRIDTVRFTRTATVDAVTGETTFSEWTPRFYTFPEEDVPVVDGYTPDRDKIPEQTVYPNGDNEEITVIYKPISYEETANVTRTVKFRYYTEDGDEASADVVQTVNLKRTYRLDPDTKERVYSAWEVTGVENEHPEIPEIDGFTHDLTAIPDFDVDMSDPKDGADVYVIYTALPITYTVTFTDGTGNVLKVQEGIPEHGSAEAPEVPVREGYTFDGWDREFDDVTGNLVVTAKWISNTEPEKRTHTVTYVDPNGTLYRQVVVEEGEAEPPAPEVSKDGFEFDGWDRSEDEDGNVTYTARWVEKETPTEPEKETEPTEPSQEPSETTTAKETTTAGQVQTVVVGGQTVTVPAGASSTVVTNPETGQTQRVFVPTAAASPNTGDVSDTMVWIITAMAAAAGIAAAAVVGRRRKE